jgi:hypothetical protein
MLNDILKQKAFEFMHDDNRWELMIDMFKTKQQQAYALLNKELVLELKEMYINDQKYRLYMLHNWDRLIKPENKKESDSLWHLQSVLDTVNFKKLKKITKQYGWPGYKIAGRYSEILITHIPSDFDYYLPLMEDAARRNDLEWVHVDILMSKRISHGLFDKKGFILNDIFFENKKSVLLANSYYEIDYLVDAIKAWDAKLKEIKLTYYYKNKKAARLSEQRITSIVDYMKKRGVKTTIIKTDCINDKSINGDYKIEVKGNIYDFNTFR